MNNKKIIFALIIIVLGGAALYFIEFKPAEEPISGIDSFEECANADYPVLESYPRQCKTPDGRTFAEDIGNELEKSDLIRISVPRPNQIIQSPLIIKGEARGFWFFEASFPVKLLDENGQLLASAVAYVQEDWMTEDFIPFEAEILFERPAAEKGTLVLEKDNPSGLPENADELRLPVKFGEAAAAETMTIKAYFNNDRLDPEFSCNKVFPVEREIPETQAVARAALEELLKGPTEEEKSAGFFTSINPGVKIQKLSIENGTLKVDFDEQLEFQVGGSCRVSAIRAQITQTLKQFSTVNEVIISVNGRTEDILQP
ncbi:MAG TPA: GerMN domain-containing protein [Patescibacteria group bacterium]|nr:GerMN domain-containing protein [Patescibacteria group bacterium]